MAQFRSPGQNMMSDQHLGVSCVTLSPDGTQIVVGSAICPTLKLWDLQNREFRQLLGHESGVTCVAWASGRRERVVSGSRDKTLKVWDIDSLQPACTATLKGHDSAVHCLALTSDGRVAISASNDGFNLK
eukprot:scaffold577252_cov13-Prasinocladus_malaysianus.AAC.1